MFYEYEMGCMFNLDVFCNCEIKFDVFMKIVFNFGVDYVVMGYYCRKGVIEKDGKEIY